MELLKGQYPGAKTALRHCHPLELLVATILSAQSTDKIVNRVTKELFRKYRKPKDYATANLQELERDIKPTGFYHNKAKFLKGTGQMLVDRFESKVPQTMDELTSLPGVARKTANVVLSKAFGVVEGIAVDTHVRRLAQRLRLSENKNQDKIEMDLMKLFPKREWPGLTDLLISHGRQICAAKKPQCSNCIINELCPSSFTF